MPSTLETNITTTGSLASDLVPVYIKEQLLMLAEKQLVFYELGDKENLPEGNGKTIQFTRYERLPLPTAPLSESITPDATALTTSIVQAVVDQWGAVVSMSDVSQLTVRHPVLRTAQQRLGTQHLETIDREIQKVLMGSSNVSFANGRSSRSALVAGDNFISDDARRAVSTLRANGAPTNDGSMYAGVLDPYVEMDITKNSDFLQAAQYSNIRALMNNEIGSWMGVRWKRSNFVPIIAAGAYANPGVVTPAANTTLNSFTGFTANSTVRAKVTKLDPQTGFETTIFPESNAPTNAAAFRVLFTFSSTIATTGTYNIYCSLQDGAAGTTTYQTRINYVAGTAMSINIAKAQGSGVVVSSGNALELVVQATGAIAPPDTSTAGNVHFTYIFGKEAFGVVDLAGLQTTLTPASPTDSDPLVQRRKAGWKQMFKACIKNVDFWRRVESLSSFN